MTQVEGLAMVQDIALQAYMLVKEDNMSIEQVAEHLEVKPKTVEVWLAMASVCLQENKDKLN